MNLEALQLWSAVLAGDAARRIGMLDVLVAGDATAEEVARHCELDVRGCQTLLDALASFGLVEPLPGGNYRAPSMRSVVEDAFKRIPERLR